MTTIMNHGIQIKTEVFAISPTRKGKRKRYGPFKADELESIRKKPKKKKKLLPDEPWLEQQKYYQDQFIKKKNDDPRWEAEKKREPWIWKERYFQDQFDKNKEDKTIELKTKTPPKKSRKKRKRSKT
ncbi:MAG: hypothetical protein ACTSRS_17615 [Candidatus Helarchaeota archaeon]